MRTDQAGSGPEPQPGARPGRAVPAWAVLSAAAAPILLIGGWTLAASRQPPRYDSTVETISSLAALDATDRWVMTVALIGLGVCHVVTALGLRTAAPAGRAVLAAGGLATALVGVFPLPRDGSSTAHGVAAGFAFLLLAVWPAVAARTWPSLVAAAVLVVLVGWFAVVLYGAGRSSGSPVGLAERVAAGAQALWPLVAVLHAANRSRRPAGGR